MIRTDAFLAQIWAGNESPPIGPWQSVCLSRTTLVRLYQPVKDVLTRTLRPAEDALTHTFANRLCTFVSDR
jgi:hypothetical protein